MKRETHAARVPISTMVARSSCPICVALRDFQNELLKTLESEHCAHFCNMPGWAIANAARAESVTTIFLSALANPDWRVSAPVPDQCDLCRQMHTEKEMRLEEIAQRFHDPKLSNWLHDFGMLCSSHSRDLEARLPKELQRTVQEMSQRNAIELTETIEEFLEQVKKGSRTGGGALGRAAEFLVAQRGIEG